MALHHELPIYGTGIRLLDLAMEVQVQMPRSFKRSLGERVHNHCVELLNLMALANASRGAERAAHIRALLTLQHTVTVLLRVGFERRLVSPKLWANSVALLGSIGKQGGGWLKRTEGHSAPAPDARPLSAGQGLQACAHPESGRAAASRGRRHAQHGDRQPRAGEPGAAPTLNGRPAALGPEA